MQRAFTDAIAQVRQLYPEPPPQSAAKTVLGLIVGTVVLAALFHLLERFFPERSGQPIVRKGTRVDFIYWFVDSLFTKRLATLAAAFLVIAAIAFKIPRFDFAGRQPLWLQVIEVLLIADLCGYWSHRMLHEIPWLWRIHRVHHSSESLDWLASARVHPLETVWTRIISVLPIFLLGFSAKVTAVLTGVIAVYPVFIHCNLSWGYGPLGYVLASPAFHRWHHASDAAAIDKNYSGLLPVFDFIFGTAYFPNEGKPERYGLAGESAPEGFGRQMIWPFGE